MSIVIGIDVGGSTTKIVGVRKGPNGEKILLEPQFVRAADPITSTYGAFGKFTLENSIKLTDIKRIMMTGVGSSFITSSIYSLPCKTVSEFSCVGLGGLYISGLDEAIVVSMGTGTALIHAKRTPEKTEIEYLGGTGVGGGTLVGLSKKILGMDNIEHIEQLCEGGDLNKIDLRIKEITNKDLFPGVNEELTASNFGNLSDIATKSDIALGIANLVAETILMISIFAARRYNIKNIVLTGNLTTIKPIRELFINLSHNFEVNYMIPERAQYGTVIGAALYDYIS